MITSRVKPRQLQQADYAHARQALGQAFFDYELMRYAAPVDRRRAAGVTALYGAILSDAFHHGEVHVAPDTAGVACWLPPESALPTLGRQVRAGMLWLPLHFGIRGFRRLLAYDAIASRLHHQHASMPHWFLAAIGVTPAAQGKGVGSQLLQPILARADAEGLHCYLDTHREKNVRLYQRHGFEIAEIASVPGHPLPVWSMLRKPAP